MLHCRLLVAGTALAAFSPSALAQSSSSWTGLYVGAHSGTIWTNQGITAAAQSLTDSKLDGNGTLWGIQAGYLLQADAFVGGLEADYSTTRAKAVRNVTSALQTYRLDANTDYAASLRARFGFAMGPLLLYGTAGLARSELKASATGSGLSSQNFKIAATDIDIVYGGGIDWKLLPNLALRTEVLRYQFAYSGLVQGLPVKLDTDTTVVRAGISYHFN